MSDLVGNPEDRFSCGSAQLPPNVHFNTATVDNGLVLSLKTIANYLESITCKVNCSFPVQGPSRGSQKISSGI